MRGPGMPTLDQMQVLVAVADAGSLAAAARKLRRATSGVSYAIDNLEAQLGVRLFDRVATRKPQLTRGGEAVVAEARAVIAQVDALRAKVKGMLDGLEAEVSLAVDVMFPTDRLVEVLQAFQAQFPTVALRLHVEALGGVTELVRDGKAVFGICNPMHAPIKGLERIAAGGVTMIPVAAASHPLAKKGNARPRDHIQLVLTDRSPLTRGQDFGVLGDKSWRLADLGAKHALLLAGVGWGSMPEPMIRADLKAGRLVPLKLRDWPGGYYALQIEYRSEMPPGPAAQWLIAKFAA